MTHRPETASTLLGRERLAHHYDSNIKVRRTFIDIDSIEDDDDDDDDRPPMIAMKSEPAKVIIPVSPLQAYLEGRGRWQKQSLESLPEVHENIVDEQGAEAALQNGPQGIVAPLESRTPQQSMGSALHDSGQCKPCAWYWRPQGCFNCASCAHCHMCGPDALKKRKKMKKKTGRESDMPLQQEPQPTVERDETQEAAHESIGPAPSDARMAHGASQTFAPAAAVVESAVARANPHGPLAAIPSASAQTAAQPSMLNSYSDPEMYAPLSFPCAPPHFPPPMYCPLVPGVFQHAPPR